MSYLPRSSAADEREPLDYEAIFGNDNGEDEDPKILAGYFVEQTSFKKAYDINRKLEFVKARKGMGKSALLSHLTYRLVSDSKPLDPNAIVIKVTGNELMGLTDFSGKDTSLLENKWKQVICKRISMQLASDLGFTASDDKIVLVEAAEIEGYKGRNLVSSLTTRLGGLIENASKALSNGILAVSAKNPTDPKTVGYEQILRRIQSSTDKNVWLIVDDIDAKFVDTPEMQARIGSFFSAVRSLAFSVEGLRVRASVRTDVWTNLREMEDEDKLRQYITDIKWSDTQLKSIFAKRILSYLQRNDDSKYTNLSEVADYPKVINEVFSGEFRFWSDRRADPLVVAMMLAGKRPRWMGQLCKQAGGAAGSRLIQQRDFNTVMGSFGKEKISDLIKEHFHQFSALQKVIDSFRDGEKYSNRFKLLSVIDKGFVCKIGSENIPTVNGFPFKGTDQIAKLLFEIDFIVAEKNSKLVPFHDDPTLFDSEANQQNKIPWLVNLSYRSFLNIH